VAEMLGDPLELGTEAVGAVETEVEAVEEALGERALLAVKDEEPQAVAVEEAEAQPEAEKKDEMDGVGIEV